MGGDEGGGGGRARSGQRARHRRRQSCGSEASCRSVRQACAELYRSAALTNDSTRTRSSVGRSRREVWLAEAAEVAAAAAAAGGGAAAAAANGSATNAVVAAAIPRGVYPTALSCGYNPQFDGTRRTCEPWILADFGEGAEFYGEEIRLVITGYLRPEAKFVSVAALVEQIHGDARDARRALADPRFLRYARDAFLTSA